MGDSSDSEEFYDAEELTPIKGSKRASLPRNRSLTGSTKSEKSEKEKDKSATKTETLVEAPSIAPTTPPVPTTDVTAPDDDRTTVKSVVQDRRRFQELRRCMQTEDDDEGLDTSSDRHSFNTEQPFKVISHDTMSLQSMTSLGRIGRILSGASDTHSNFREAAPAAARAPRAGEPAPADRAQSALAEPDVIASTKAKPAAGPLPPPRRKKRNKLYGSQSFSTTDGDNLSVCTTDTDEYAYAHRRVPDAQLESLTVEPPPSCSPPSAALPSPASTIESLTREFQDSLELSNSKYALDKSSSHESRTSSRSSTGASLKHKTAADSALDIKEAVRGEYVVRAADEAPARSAARTHSEGRAQLPTGHSSLGGNSSRRSNSEWAGSGRRRSAGDEQLARSASGQRLTDMQILEQVTVLNLDTGERVPLSVAEHKLPQCINPLSLHIMRLTSEYIGRDGDDNARETDEESESVCVADDDTKEAKRDAGDSKNTIRKKTEKLKRFLGSTVKKTVFAAKSLAQEVSHARHKEDVADIADDVRGEHNIKLKASHSHKGPYDFDQCVRHVQEMGSGHSGAVWCCKFSVCGRLLATAGQDKLLRVWVARDAYSVFQDMRTKYSAEGCAEPAPEPAPRAAAPFRPAPFCVYRGHTSDLLDVSWSKNYFLLSSSMDKTVRLWHISRGECLCCFQHIDFVTAIVFHPRDDRYFLSGSLDGKLRLWNIPDKKVAVWNEVDGKTKLITAANFCQNGKFAVVGTYDGRCIFYTTDQLKYHTQIDVRSTRGKNSTGRKISGIEPMPNDDKILVTSNDSRIRLYDLRDLNLSCKYKGYVNVSSQIKASFSHDGRYIVSGSENQCIYIWKTCHDYSKFTSVRRDRNDFWEGIKAHNAVVTCAVFAPNPDHVIRTIAARELEEKERAGLEEEEPKPAEGMVSSSQTGHVLVSADFNGCIKVFVHKAKPKHSSLPASALA